MKENNTLMANGWRNTRDLVKRPPEQLYNAIASGKKLAAQFLISIGTDVNAVNELGNSPLLAACCRGKVDEAKALLQAGANVLQVNNQGATALHVAIEAPLAEKPALDLVTALIEQGADIEQVGGRYQETPLITAIRHSGENAAMVQLLLDAGADPNKIGNQQQETPLIAAIRHRMDDPTIVQRLLVASANVNQRTPFGHNALSAACSQRCAKIKHLLLERGAHMDRLGELAYPNGLVAMAAGFAERDGVPRALPRATLGATSQPSHSATTLETSFEGGVLYCPQ